MRAQREGLEVVRLSALALPNLARHCDIVHAHDARSHALAAMFRRAPLVVSRRVAFPLHRDLLSRHKYARADRYLAVSNYVAGVLAAGGVPPGKIEVIYDGVPLLPISERQGAILTPASNDPLKGVRLVLEAARQLRVQVVPSVDLEHDLTEASLFIYITRTEGLGSAILLAMSAGVPVIASAVRRDSGGDSCWRGRLARRKRFRGHCQRYCEIARKPGARQTIGGARAY